MIFCSCGRFILAFICDIALETPFMALAIADWDLIVYRGRGEGGGGNRYSHQHTYM